MLTFQCSACKMQIGNVTGARCGEHGPMVPLPQGASSTTTVRTGPWHAR